MTVPAGVALERRNHHNSSQMEVEPRPAAAQESLALDLLAGGISLRRAEASVTRTQAALLAYLAEARRYQDLTYASITDLAEERLQIRPRTTAERLRLHRLLTGSPLVEEAFLTGRLTQCQILALAPVLKAGTDVQSWIAESQSLPVREIRRRVRLETDAHGVEPSPEETDGRTLSFQAPPPFQVAWREMLERTRSVLGYQAPQYRCLEAILMETGFAGRGTLAAREKRKRTDPPKPAPKSLRPASVPYDPEAAAEAQRTFSGVEELISDLQDLLESDLPLSACEALDRLVQLGRLLHPIRVFLGRILRDLRRTRSFDLLGYPDLGSFVEEALGFSERTGRNRIAEAFLFEDRPLVEAAYGRGEIGIVKAHLIDRVVPGSRLPEWIERAREVTVRQFEREVRLLWLLRRCDRHAAVPFRGPFPIPGLETALIEALCDGRGWTRKRLNRAMRDRSLTPRSAGESEDPAENRALLDRVEFLVDRLILSLWDTPPSISNTLPGDLRQTCAGLDGRERISIWLPEETRADLDVAFREIRHRSGLAVPLWAVLTVLLAEATAVWETHDPQARPRGLKILRRDRYRCCVPGCRSRRGLEVHHIEFRSQGGTNDPGNLITLCHAHHQRILHEGKMRLTGTAPDRLIWTIEIGPGDEQLLRLCGDRYLG